MGHRVYMVAPGAAVKESHSAMVHAIRPRNLHFVLFLDTSWKGQNTTSSFVTYSATLQGGAQESGTDTQGCRRERKKKYCFFN
jgi:hypothetical protein